MTEPNAIKYKPYKHNPRKITSKQLESLEDTLRRLGDLSGTTIIACKNTGRVAYCSELSSNYCSSIIQRYIDSSPTSIIKVNGQVVYSGV